MNIPPTNELVAFQKVANRLSFRKASEELNVTPSTLSHLIRSLEERLKTRLLNRTTRSVALTEPGRKLFVQLNAIPGNLSDVLEGLHEEAGRAGGTIRINTGDVAARIFLRKFEPILRERYPDIHLEMFVEDGFTDIVSEGFDAGIRLRDTVPVDMIAVPLGRRFRFVLAASPDYIEKHGLPKKPQDLLKHDCIRFRFQNGRLHEWAFRKQSRKVSVDVKGPMTLNHNGLVIEATGSKVRSDCVATRSSSSLRRAAALISKARLPPSWIIKKPICADFSAFWASQTSPSFVLKVSRWVLKHVAALSPRQRRKSQRLLPDINGALATQELMSVDDAPERLVDLFLG